MNKQTDLELFIKDKIIISDADAEGCLCIPKIKPYLSKTSTKMIENFITEQKEKGVNFNINDEYDFAKDIVGLFEISKLIRDYYRQNEQVPRSEVKKLKDAIKMCAKHIKKFDINHEISFDKLLQIDDKKYFHENNLENYRHFFNEPFVQSLKKQSSKYPVLLFNEIIAILDTINKKGYKNKETRLSQELKKLILKVFDLKTSVLRVEDKKEYLTDIKRYQRTIQFYFEIVSRYRNNDHITKDDLSTTDPEEFIERFAFVSNTPMPYDRLCIKEERYLKQRSLLNQLEQYKVLTKNKIEEAKNLIAEIEAEFLEMIERQPVLHGFNIEDKELFYSIVKQIRTIEQK